MLPVRARVWIVFAFALLVSSLGGVVRAQNYEQAYEKLKSDWAKAYAENKAPFDKTAEAAEKAYRAISVANAKIQLADNDKQKKEAQAELETASAGAYTQYKLALAKLPDETDENRERLNEIRYRVAFLSYETKHYLDAATLAEYICRKYPKNKFALHSSKIAIACYRLQYNEADKAKDEKQKDAMLKSLMDICAYTSKQFDKTPEGADARRILAELALYAKNVEQAEQILQMFEAGSEQHSQLLLKIAQVKWFKYFEESKKPDGERLAPDKLKRMKTEAKAAFKNATDAMRKKEGNQPSSELLKGELSLVQIYNMDGQFEDAKKLLDVPRTGLLECARLNLKSIQSEKNMRQLIYTSSLKTNLGLKNFKGAENAAKALAALGGGKTDPKDMTALFGSLAKGLYDDVKTMQASGASREELQVAADSLSGMLIELASRKEGHTYQSLVWPAEKLFELGELFNTEDGPSDKSKEYIASAVKIYNDILTRGQENPEFVTESNVNAIREKVAKCQLKVGNSKDALTQLIEILAKFPNRVPAQLDAAYAYQDLAEMVKKPEGYDLAMTGGDPRPAPDGKGPPTNVVWGWNKLARMTQQSPQHESIYYESRYNLAYCRMKKAMLTEKAEEKTEGLIQALNDVRVTYVLNPKLGDKGDDKTWQSKYDTLTKTLQGLLKQDQTGLAGLEPGAPGSVEKAKKVLAARAEAENPEPESPTNFVAIALVALLGMGSVGGIIYFFYLKPKRPATAYRRH